MVLNVKGKAFRLRVADNQVAIISHVVFYLCHLRHLRFPV